METVDPLEGQVRALINANKIRLVPYPAIAVRLNELISSGNYDNKGLKKIIQTDQAISAQVLRAANSSLYAVGTPITTLDRAIAQIGAADLKRLVLACSLRSTASSSGELAGLRRLIREESVNS